MAKDVDMAYLYIGSVNIQSAQTIIEWSDVSSATPKGKGALYGVIQNMMCLIALVCIILHLW